MHIVSAWAKFTCYACACNIFRQIEAVRRIKGNECSYEVDRIEEECVSGSAFRYMLFLCRVVREDIYTLIVVVD